MVLRTERTSWAFSDRHLVPSQDPIPLALLRSGNMFREWALDSLTAQGRTWRIVLSSTSIGAVEAAAAAGMAITVVKERTARAGLRMLGEAEGLPSLPVSEIALHIAPGKISAAARGLAEYLISELKE
jgi:DNA-binding transcriptional LysR family regulator